MIITPLDGPLSLTNDGSLDIVFLGTGTAFAKTLNQTNFLIIKGDTHVLVDFGMTGPAALRELGVGAENIQNVLPTHSHADHIGGLEFLSLVNRYNSIPSGKPKLSMVITEEYKSVLWDYSLRGGLEYNEVNVDGERLQFSDFYNTHMAQPVTSAKRSTFQVNVGDISLELFHTNHIPGNVGKVEDAFITYGVFVDNRVFLSGDTKFDTELVQTYADRSEIMFHDASLIPNPVHASTAELLTLPEEIRSKMLLMHYQDHATDEDATGFMGLAKVGNIYRF